MRERRPNQKKKNCINIVEQTDSIFFHLIQAYLLIINPNEYLKTKPAHRLNTYALSLSLFHSFSMYYTQIQIEYYMRYIWWQKK